MRLIALMLALALNIALMSFAAVAQPHGRKAAKTGVLAAPVVDDPEFRVVWEAFTAGLRNLGWIEYQNVVFERRSVAEEPDKATAELISLRPDIVVSGLSEPGVVALKKAMTTIPIVMLVSADPVGTGLVASLCRP